jgi:hypothetical protein
VSTAVDNFIAELRADRDFARSADLIDLCIEALDREANINPSAAGLYEVLHWVISHQQHTLHERMNMVHRLVTYRGKFCGTPREFTGWR